ncbi:hypothetical protein [Flavobacterium aquicola]|uniref:AraC family transcriptional regulator n=1 Tax=Flavobacterium aquicola TaxID=1682742 RepID=A0A3E0ERC9_9FLAO|nr:hypothetical protein [Flavobacterium aquicola]REH00773.1 AraC family transcriptional regulator [Flavobacterium aquicola]
MKNIYLKAGKTQDVFNDLKDNFNGILSSGNDEFNVSFASVFAKGNIKGIEFPEGMTYMQFDMIFHDNVRMSIEPLNNSPVFLAYCMDGSLQHSFGEHGKRKSIKKQQTGILKSNSNVNSILHFEKHVPIKFNVIAIGTNHNAAYEPNAVFANKLKKTFSKIEENYLDVSPQCFEISQKIEELNTMPHKGIVRNMEVNRILEKIVELEIEQQTDSFSKLEETINSFTLKQIDHIKSTSGFIKNLSLELFTTDFIVQKAMTVTNKLQKEFKLMFTRSVHEFLLYIRIERERI